MQLQSIEKYKSYNFETNQSWRNYLDNLYPVPSHNSIEKFKRKWYKNNVDSEFDINFDLSQQGSQQQKEQNQSQGSPSQEENKQNFQQNQQSFPNDQQQSPKKHFLVEIAFTFEAVLKGLFFISLFATPQYTGIITGVICVLAIIRIQKRPRFSKEYAKKLMENEFFQNLLFLASFSLIQRKSFFFFIAFAIHFVIGIAEYMQLRQRNSKLYKMCQQYIEKISYNKNILKLQKAKFEIQLLFVMIAMVFMRQISILAVFLYGNMLRMKYMVNNFTQRAFYDMNYWIENTLLSSRFFPSIFKVLYEKVIKKICIFLIPTDPRQK